MLPYIILTMYTDSDSFRSFYTENFLKEVLIFKFISRFELFPREGSPNEPNDLFSGNYDLGLKAYDKVHVMTL